MWCLKLPNYKSESPLRVASSVFRECKKDCVRWLDYGARWYNAGIGRLSAFFAAINFRDAPSTHLLVHWQGRRCIFHKH